MASQIAPINLSDLFAHGTSSGVWSPALVRHILNALHLGCAHHSTLNTALKTVQGGSRSKESSIAPSPCLKMWNGFLSKTGVPIDKKYADQIRALGFLVESCEFSEADRNRINGVVEKSTAGLVPSLIEKFDPAIIFCLVSTMTINLKWQHSFESGKSHEFVRSNGTKVPNHPMMKGDVSIFTTKAYTVAHVPTADKRFGVFFIISNDGKGTLYYPAYELLGKGKPGTDTVFLPIFTMSSDWDVKQLLAPHLPTLFQGTHDLSGITSGPVQITQFKTKVRVDCNPQGIVAGAAGYAEASRSFCPEPVVFNRPFTGCIVDMESGQTLFWFAYDGVSS